MPRIRREAAFARTGLADRDLLSNLVAIFSWERQAAVFANGEILIETDNGPLK